MYALTRGFQRTKERPLISTGTQKPKRWLTHGDLTCAVAQFTVISKSKFRPQYRLLVND